MARKTSFLRSNKPLFSQLIGGTIDKRTAPESAGNTCRGPDHNDTNGACEMAKGKCINLARGGGPNV